MAVAFVEASWGDLHVQVNSETGATQLVADAGGCDYTVLGTAHAGGWDEGSESNDIVVVLEAVAALEIVAVLVLLGRVPMHFDLDLLMEAQTLVVTLTFEFRICFQSTLELTLVLHFE